MSLQSSRDFDERWAAWQARGHARERNSRLRLMIWLPLLAVVAATFYGLFGR